MRTRAAAVTIAGLLLAVHAPASTAGEVEHAAVEQDNGRYSLDLAMRIDSDPAAVYELVTDYAGLARISDTILESEVITAADTDGIRRRLVTQTCVWFFCFKATMVEDVRETDGRAILTTMVPALSDYRYGTSRWQVSAADAGTRIHFTTTLEPDFWVPPLIGPWLMKQKMRAEAERTVLTIERLTRNKPETP